MNSIRKISEHTYAMHLEDGRVFTLSNNMSSSVENIFWRMSDQNWEYSPQSVCGRKIIPYGNDNRLPTNLRNILDENNLGPGILERQMGLLWGQGPYLNKLSFEGGKITRQWQEDREIKVWLESWDYIGYLKGCMTDYLHLKGFFDAKYLEKGYRIGHIPKIACLEHIPAKNARLEWTDTRNIKDVHNIIVGDFENNCLNTGVKVYPIYDRKNPARYPVSASYNHTYSFSRDFYAVPQYWGALRWLVRGSEIPNIFKYVTDNGINLAYHIRAPHEYWENKRLALQEQHPSWDSARVENEISSLTAKLLKDLTQVLSGKENAGKFFYTIDLPSDSNGEHVSWKIEAIDQKIKDFVESQLKISEASTSAITSGMGLHPSLSNVMVNGKLASGSELLYAFKLYLLSDTEIASSVILEPINQAIAFNFPNKDLKLGFYHQSLKSEEDITTSDRIKNN